MRRTLAFFRLTFLGTTAIFLFVSVIPARTAEAEVYVHYTPLKIGWDHPTPERVHHYNVYVSVDDAPFELFAQAPTCSFVLQAEDGKKYVIQVDAEDAQGRRSPMSDPLAVVVYLNGSAEDTDGDGMNDDWEFSFGFNPFDPADGKEDYDNDGLLNREEFSASTNPTNPDTDRDGIPDGAEVQGGLDPTNASDNAPVAQAGEDQEVDPTVVTLDGSGSFDPNGDPLTYAWWQVEGTVVELSDDSVPTPRFLGKKCGHYRFELQVSDGRAASAPDEVSVTIHNVAPTADAGQDQVVDAGTQVVLDGGGSQDPNGDPLSFSWRQYEGPSVTLSEPLSRTTRFVPDLAGVYRFELVVSDGQLSSLADTVRVVVNAINRVPTANAGEDQLALVNEPVILDGSGSTDPEGAPLSYSWRQVQGPVTVTVGGASSAVATFTPLETGPYRFELVVSDQENTSPPDDVAVTVEDENRVPLAVIADVAAPVTVGDWVILDGQGSHDPDGDALGYLWTQTAGAQVSLDDTASPVIGFYAVTEGVLRFQLVVDDGELASTPAFVEVTVNGMNQVPVAEAGADLQSRIDREVCLNGTGSYDPDSGDTLTYSWSQSAGLSMTLYNPDTPTPCFRPSSPGKYKFILIVSDGSLQSAADEVCIRVKK